MENSSATDFSFAKLFFSAKKSGPIDWEADVKCHEIEGGSFEEQKGIREIESA